MFTLLQKDSESILTSVVELVYFMRGAISYEEMLRRTPGERHIIARFLEKRLESEKKSPHPIY